MNIFSYLDWRGDISLSDVPLCEADFAVLCSCAYFPFDGIVEEGFSQNGQNLWDAVSRVKELAGIYGDGRSFHYKEDDEMTEHLLNCPRFIKLSLTGFRNIIDEEKEEQFSALTFVLPDKRIVIAFRGTDMTLTGWKEDFNMVYLDQIPSQADSLKYLLECAGVLEGDIYLCGHSKGGNLALYAAAYCPEDVKKRIKRIVSLDGPGFDREKIMSKEFLSVKDRLFSYVPQQSIVGMLLEHLEEHCVVHSTGAAFGQHTLYTWEVRRGSFIREPGVKRLSRRVDITLKNWIRSMDDEKKERIVEGFWKVVVGSGVGNVEDLFTFKAAMRMVRAMRKLDEDTKNDMSEAVRLFKNAYKKMQSDRHKSRRRSFYP